MAEPIVRVLYARGAFAATGGTPLVASVLAVFGLGLPAFVLTKAFTPGFFAREDTRTPMIFAAISVAINIVTALILFPEIGAPGIAVASAIAGWVNCILLFATLWRRGQWGNDRALLLRIPRLVAAAIVMAVAARYAIDHHLAGWFLPSQPTHVQAVALMGVVLVSMIVYFAIAFGTGGASLGMLRRNLRRGGGAPAPAPGDDA